MRQAKVASFIYQKCGDENCSYQATCNSLDFGGVMTELNNPVMEDEKLWNAIMDLTPLKRWMSVEEAAEWIYFMAVKTDSAQARIF